MVMEVHEIRGLQIFIDRETETYPVEYWNMAAEGTWEPETLDFIDWLGDQGEAALIDVGAASGIVTLYALGRGVSVLAVEPSIPDFRALQSNLAQRHSQSSAVRTLWAVVGDRTGSMSYTDEADPTLLAPITFREGTQDDSIQVPIVLLESLLNDAIADYSPDLLAVKIDVEGAEFKILTPDALRSLHQAHCIVDLSIHPGAPGSAPDRRMAKNLWRLRTLFEVVSLVRRIRKRAIVAMPGDPSRRLGWWSILRRLDGPDKTIMCDFR
jgi:FkbM family methyltransferase